MGENFGPLLERRKWMVKNKDANSSYGKIDKKNNVSSNTMVSSFNNPNIIKSQ